MDAPVSRKKVLLHTSLEAMRAVGEGKMAVAKDTVFNLQGGVKEISDINA